MMASVSKTKPLPSGATNIRATNNEPKKIIISWNASATNDVVKYEIHRSTFRAFGYEKIKEVNANTFEYIDSTDVAGKSYYYKIIAVDKDGLESLPEPIQGMSFNNINITNSLQFS